MSTVKLRSDLVFVSQTYRGEQTWIVKDPASRKYFRFRPVEVRVMQELDGTRSADEVAAALRAEGIGLSAAAIVSFGRRLRQLGLCEETLEQRSMLALERLRAERARVRRPRFIRGDLLRLRWSLGSPDRLLERWLPRIRFCFTRQFLVASVVLFGIYAAILAARWPAFAEAVATLYTPSLLTVEAVVVLWVTATVIIAIHELGHGFACKYFGGQVHEIGAMLIYFQPAFYCDVNDAWTFPERRARLWVTAAGSWIQLVLASLAAIVWWLAAPGTLVEQVALAAVLIGGATTVLANLNPLIPLDGYYALSDWLEVPNLRKRAFAHLGWVVRRRLLGLDVPAPPADARERRIFVIYGLLASAYIALILGLTALIAAGWVAEALGTLGALLVVGAIGWALRDPIRRWGQAVTLAARRHRDRLRTTGGRLGMAGAGMLLVLALVPWPITVPGRYRMAPERTVAVVAPDSGVVESVTVAAGSAVGPGGMLLRLRNVELERALVAARRAADSLAVAEERARAARHAAEARRLEDERRAAVARLGGLAARVDRLTVRSGDSAVVLTDRPELLVGRSVSVGEPLLVLGGGRVQARIAVRDAGALQIRPGQAASLWLPGDDGALAVEVGEVSAGADAGSGAVEVRAPLPADAAVPLGVSGPARVTVRRSTLLGAAWWTTRRLVRPDLLL